ncbi:MAG: hypothetical protein LBE62_02295 [Azonexus sp.]|jgi:hypothetical protein|nr:hypothetical protein [Azonexus sp.]
MATKKSTTPAAEQAATATAFASPLPLAGEGSGERVPGEGKPLPEITPTRYHVRALPAKGFRRAGRWWPSGDGVEVAASMLTETQIAQLLAEPMLAVVAIVDTPTDS